MILSFAINREIIIVFSRISFCLFHHQSSMYIFVRILSSLSLNWRIETYVRFARKEEWLMKNLIVFITFRYWIVTISLNSSSIFETMIKSCFNHVFFWILVVILLSLFNHWSSFLKLSSWWNLLNREFWKNLSMSFLLFSLWWNQCANA
jgi:hypothetical protein